MKVFPTPEFEANLDAATTGEGIVASDSNTSIVDVFDQRAAERPDKKAILSGARSISYGELANLSDRVANGVLNSSGESVKPVALMFGDTLSLIAAILGVLKCNRPYIVLDPGYPKVLLDSMLLDSTADILIHDRPAGDAVAGDGASARQIPYQVLIDASTDGDPGIVTSPDSLALLIYTSGSTGRPLGVMHTHQNILDEVQTFADALSVDHRDTWIHYASPSFASAIRSIYGALLNGGTLVLYDIRQHGFAHLKETVMENNVTIWRSLPSAFRHFMATLDEGVHFNGVRVLSLGGETVTRTDIGYFNRHFHPDCVLSTSFGPTECLGACWGFIRHGTAFDGEAVPLGYQRPGKQVSIVDEAGNPVADGEVGEIAVSGDNLSSGYWNDPETTARRFVVGRNGFRTFLTGDLGRRDGNGLIQHLGRRDFQVKIRGYRIETTEIETSLREIGGVDDAVVAAVKDGAGDFRLTAFLLAPQSEDGFAEEVRRALAEKLPDYMIPAEWVLLKAFPLGPTGKVDRRALSGRRVAQKTSEQSMTEQESIIHSIWGRVLGRAPTGLERSFFGFGGDSLKAAQCAKLMSDHFGVTVPMTLLMRVSGIRETAAFISRLQESTPGGEPVYIEPPQTFRYHKPQAPEGSSKEIVLLGKTDTMRGAIHVVRKGGEEELHSHKTVDGFWMVLTGRVRFYGDGELLGEFGPLEGILLPRHNRYRFESMDGNDAELLQVLNFEPGRDFQRENHAKANYDKGKMSWFDGRAPQEQK